MRAFKAFMAQISNKRNKGSPIVNISTFYQNLRNFKIYTKIYLSFRCPVNVVCTQKAIQCTLSLQTFMHACILFDINTHLLDVMICTSCYAHLQKCRLKYTKSEIRIEKSYVITVMEYAYSLLLVYFAQLSSVLDYKNMLYLLVYHVQASSHVFTTCRNNVMSFSLVKHCSVI